MLIESNSDIGFNQTPQLFSFANKCMNSLTSMFETLPLQFCLSNSKANVPCSDFTILEPEFDCSTQKYEDIERILDQIRRKFVDSMPHTFVLVSGDQQTWIQMWMLRKKYADKYS